MLGVLVVLFQPAQRVGEGLHIRRLIARFVMLGRGNAIDDVINLFSGPLGRALRVEQISGNAEHPLGQSINGASQSVHLPVGIHQLGSKSASDIATADDQNSAFGHLKLLKKSNKAARKGQTLVVTLEKNRCYCFC